MKDSERMYDLRVVNEFLGQLSTVGFGRGMCTGSSVLASFKGPYNQLLRQFYLASMGLGEFKLKLPEVIDMRGPSGWISVPDWDNALTMAKDYIPHGNAFDQSFYFNLRRMKLLSPLKRKEPRITLTEALQRLKRKRKSLGSVWQMQWLFLHQECLPLRWRKILADGGKIIFPRCPLISKTPEDETEFYPFIQGARDEEFPRFKVEPSDDILISGARDFIACVPDAKKNPPLG